MGYHVDGRPSVLVIAGRKRGGSGHIRAVELDVEVLHQSDGRVVGQVSAAGSRCRAEAVRVSAQVSAEGAGRTSSYSDVGQR